MAAASLSASGLLCLAAALFAALCGANGHQTGDDTSVRFEPRQGLGAGTSPSLQLQWAQLLQRQNSPVFPVQQQSLNTPGTGLETQSLPFSPLQSALVGQALATPLQTLGSQGLFGRPFTGLGGTQLMGNPGLIAMLPGVNRLGRLGATSQLGGGQLGILPGALGLHPLLAQQAPIRHDNLGQLLLLANLLSDEPGVRRNTPATPNTRLQLRGTFSHRPQHPHPLNRLFSLPTNTHERPRTSRVTLDGRSPAGFPDRANLENNVRPVSPQPSELGKLPYPLSLTSQPSLLPLSTGTHRPSQLDGFRFPSK